MLEVPGKDPGEEEQKYADAQEHKASGQKTEQKEQAKPGRHFKILI